MEDNFPNHHLEFFELFSLRSNIEYGEVDTIKLSILTLVKISIENLLLDDILYVGYK